jgi:anaphase-promoting complex subunit 5
MEDFEAVTRPHQSVRPGRSLYDLFLNGLWAIDSLHTLHEFFGRLEGYLVPPQQKQQHDSPSSRILLSRTSPLGIFFRRAQVEFTRLHFADAARLWTSFLKFRASTEAAWKKKNPVATGPTFDLAIAEFDVHKPDRLSLAAYGSTDANALEDTGPSPDDIERLLEFDLDKLQRFGSRVPKAMQDHIKNIIAVRSNTPNVAYFVSFFDSWRAGDFTGAFENLHRYFDYTVRNRDKTFYQYALLHMAILQADFGCFDEAVASMNETIATARENQDTSCLNFSLSWLSHLIKAYPNDLKQAGYAGMLGSEKDRLAFLSEKAKESKNWSLLSSTLLSEAKLALSLGGDPSIVNEHLYQSAHLNFVHHIFSNCGTQLLIESAMYARTGLNMLADNDCEILLDCYKDKSPVEDVVRAMCRRAQGATQFGQYARANEIVESFSEDTLRTLKLNQYVTSHSGLVRLKHTLRKYDLVAAEHMLHQLQAAAWSDPELDFQIAILEIDYLVRQKSLPSAFDKLEDRLEEAAKTQADVVHHIMLLLLKAELFSKAGRAGKGFTIVLRAASMAYRYKLMPLLWEAMGALANILSFFGEFDHASRLMDAILPQVSSTDSLAVTMALTRSGTWRK